LGPTNIKRIDQSFSLNKPIGMLTKFYFLIFLFFISVHSTPIDCLSAGEAVILEQDPCENKDVCQYQCSNLIPGCSATAHFSDFMNAARGTSKSNSKAYIDICIKRTSSSTSWINQEVYRIAVHEELSSVKIQFPRYVNNLRSLLDAFLASKKEKFIYLAHLTEVILSFQKLCEQNKNFKKNAASLFDRLVLGDSSVFGVDFTGSEIVKQYLVENLRKMQVIALKNNKLQLNVHYLKRSFLANIDKGNQYCDCKSLFNTGIFPPMVPIVQKECNRLCGKLSLNLMNLILKK
jgi:hypothetical protein